MTPANGASRIRARRCPRALLAMWTWQAALGLLVAFPAASIVGRAFGSDPRPDERLWAPGGLALLTLLRRETAAIHGELTLAALGLLVAATGGLLPLAATLVALLGTGDNRRRTSFAFVAARAARALPTLVGLLCLATATQALMVGAAAVAAKVVQLCAHDALGEAPAVELAILAVAPFAAAVLWIGIVHDLARAAAVRLRVGTLRAADVATRLAHRNRWKLLWGWGWRQAVGWGAVGAAAVSAGTLLGHSSATLVALAVAHQSAAGFRVALRNSWLAHALRAADGCEHAGVVTTLSPPAGAHDIRARSGAPFDPSSDPVS